MSPPAQNALSPAPSITSIATPSSSAQSSSAASIRVHMSQVRALSALGRLSVMRPARPSTRIRMSSLILGPDPLHLSENTQIPGVPSARRQHAARHDQPHDLVGALEDLVHAQIAHHLLDPVIGQVPVAAMQLQAL